MSETFYLPFEKKIAIAHNTYSFYFKRNKTFDFKAGEYIRITLMIENPDSRGSSRYFTIASSPRDYDYLIITTKIIKSSFKKKLASLKRGEKVKFYGPLGNFVIDEKDNRTKVFLAGGIGITTFHSMIKYYSKTVFKGKIILLVSFSDPLDVIFYDELLKISKENDSIKVVYLKGRIDRDEISKNVSDYKDAIYYIVGPDVMVESITEIVSGLGVNEESIIRENFPGY